MKGWVILSSFVLLIAPTAFGGIDFPIDLANGAEARIRIGSCYGDIPSSGYFPVAININNDSASARTWNFQFNSPGYLYVPRDSMTFNVDLTVQSKSNRTFKLLVPLSSGATVYSSLSVTVSGPWAKGLMQPFPTGHRGKPPSAFVAMSNSLATASWSQLEGQFEGKKMALLGTRFEPNELPDDWRALVGIAGLWLTADELHLLSAPQRAALREWVYRGGSLFIHGAGDLDPQFRLTGFGSILTIRDLVLDIPLTTSAIDALGTGILESQLNNEYSSAWQAVTSVGSIKLNASLLIGFMALFAVVAGPVNLFLFSGRTRRHRLFWTTPLISLSAATLLLIIIVFQDGTGGWGSRVALVYVSPSEKEDVRLQEQVARTGVLLSSAFATKAPCFIAPIELARLGPSRLGYENLGNNFGGAWFVSRSVQAHWIESIAPTRAGIVLANAALIGDATNPPVIISNISGLLEQVYFRDENGRTWHASDVHTGERVTMQSEAQIPDLLTAEAGPRLRMMWNRVIDRKGYFYAVTKDTGSLVETLPSIQWNNDRVIYTGPLPNAGPHS